MVQKQIRYKKGIAIEMRQKGFSYSEIQNRLGVPKSTLNSWLGKMELDAEAIKKLHERRIDALRKSRARRVSHLKSRIETIQNTSSGEISKLSQRDLWLMGIILYWRERLSDDFTRGVRFSNSNPLLLKFFLKWLKEVGQITTDEIKFDIFVNADRRNSTNDIISYWSDSIDVPKHSFTHIYFQKIYRHKSQGVKQGVKKEKLNMPQAGSRAAQGFIRIRVKASSLLARQISGWIKGIQHQYWK